jgi:hypothetical protein
VSHVLCAGKEGSKKGAAAAGERNDGGGSDSDEDWDAGRGKGKGGRGRKAGAGKRKSTPSAKAKPTPPATGKQQKGDEAGDKAPGVLSEAAIAEKVVEWLPEAEDAGGLALPCRFGVHVRPRRVSVLALSKGRCTHLTAGRQEELLIVLEQW